MINATVKQNIQDRIEARAAKKRKLTAKEAAEFLRVHHGTMSNWRGKGMGPPYSKTGGKIFYFQEDLERFEMRVQR